MQAPVYLIQNAIAEMCAQVINSGRLTLADRYGLMAAIFDENLSEEERSSIDRLLHAVRRGRVKIVNEISTVQ